MDLPVAAVTVPPAGDPPTSETRPALIFALAVTALAGFIDAIGYAALGKLYLSFMSGNSTRLGMALADGDRATVLLAGAVIASFVLGVGAGTLLADAAGRHKLPAVLAAEAGLFALALGLTLAAPGAGALLPIAVAMGMQNNVHQVVLHADIGKSFVTGALVSFGQALARALRDGTPKGEARAYAASWAVFVAGVTAGGLWMLHGGLIAALATALGLVTAFAAAAWPWRGRD